ncbi:MAG: 30S ribosomal protein S16 [Anaerohalosphaera sp.]|nr:30S ribosomal protein S16 [Anaerohalosphaera sp.]
MSVKIRMSRMGRRHRPFYRINAVDSRTPRDGRILEKLGHFDPIEKDESKQVVLDIERVQFWLDQGAVPSDTVIDILKKLGVTTKLGEQNKARRDRAKAIARKKSKPFNEAERIAVQKKIEAEAKAVEDAAKAAEEAAKAKEEAAKKAEEEAAAAVKAAEEAEAAKAKAAEEAAAAKKAEEEAAAAAKAAEEAAPAETTEEAAPEGE